MVPNNSVFGKRTAFALAMVRTARFITILFVASLAWAQTPVEDLARVLRDKQIITSTDYDRIVHASPGDDVALLKSILVDKGILTNAELTGTGARPVTTPVAPSAPPRSDPRCKSWSAASAC